MQGNVQKGVGGNSKDIPLTQIAPTSPTSRFPPKNIEQELK